MKRTLLETPTLQDFTATYERALRRGDGDAVKLLGGGAMRQSKALKGKK